MPSNNLLGYHMQSKPPPSIADKFGAIPLEPDTRLYSRKRIQVGGLDAVFEWWSWDGDIEGYSVIFCSDDVAHLSEEAIKALVRSDPAIDSDLTNSTFKRGDQYTFINFNFS